MQPIFTIELHKKDIALLEMIKNTLGGVGKINSPRESLRQYRVSSFRELEGIINHFDKYPLISKKRADYELFKVAVEIMNRGRASYFRGITRNCKY